MCPFTTPAWHLSCHVYNSIKWAFECIINAFFESHRAHCCKRGREVGSVGRKDIGDPSSPPSPLLISSFKLRFLLSSVFFSSNILRLPFLELFKVLHLPFIPFLPSHLSPHAHPVLLIPQNTLSPCHPLHPSTPIPPSPHDCTLFSTVVVSVSLDVCVRMCIC